MADEVAFGNAVATANGALQVLYEIQPATAHAKVAAPPTQSVVVSGGAGGGLVSIPAPSAPDAVAAELTNIIGKPTAPPPDQKDALQTLFDPTAKNGAAPNGAAAAAPPPSYEEAMRGGGGGGGGSAGAARAAPTHPMMEMNLPPPNFTSTQATFGDFAEDFAATANKPFTGGRIQASVPNPAARVPIAVSAGPLGSVAAPLQVQRSNSSRGEDLLRPASDSGEGQPPRKPKSEGAASAAAAPPNPQQLTVKALGPLGLTPAMYAQAAANPPNPNQPQAPSGYDNVGNTCYLNSLFQCLMGSEAFMKTLRAATDALPQSSPDVGSVAKHFLRLNTNPALVHVSGMVWTDSIGFGLC